MKIQVKNPSEPRSVDWASIESSIECLEFLYENLMQHSRLIEHLPSSPNYIIKLYL